MGITIQYLEDGRRDIKLYETMVNMWFHHILLTPNINLHTA